MKNKAIILGSCIILLVTFILSGSMALSFATRSASTSLALLARISLIRAKPSFSTSLPALLPNQVS